MGFGVPASMGAKVAMPDDEVWCIDGDGCFQMTCQELATMAFEKIPVKIGIMNNAHLGMVRQWQELFYTERYSQGTFGWDIPDYVKLAEAYGCVGLRCESVDEVDALARSEEHTSELQSRPHLVCRLLLEKKKASANPNTTSLTRAVRS